MISFKLNRKIEVYSENELKMGDSTLQDEDKENIFISFPMGRGEPIKLRPGEIIRAMYSSEDGKIYEFMTVVEDIITEDRIPLIKIHKPREYQVIQRREFVRVPIMLDVEFLVIDEKLNITGKSPDELKDPYSSKKWTRGYAYDLSAGGLGAVLQDEVIYGEQILCIILDEYFDTGFVGRVVRFTKHKQAGKKIYKMGVQFIGLDYRSEEKLVKYIFQKMREQLKVR